jgi:hypothetical protein
MRIAMPRTDDNRVDWGAAAVWAVVAVFLACFWAGVGFLVDAALADTGPRCSTPAVIVGHGYATSSVECDS